ncbi:MAG TPA: HAMP domain-containing sensor histidine kinase, partial [Gemmatimonadaceae bacterium]|nr:HAMP domain-containing sensor histidine kinase [Gemmatimonadaceae bacterium]
MPAESVGVAASADAVSGVDTPLTALPVLVHARDTVPEDMSPEVWRALERATEQARIVFDGSAESTELREFLLAVKRAVHRIIAHEAPGFDEARAVPPAVRVLDYVRRAFIDELRAEDPEEAQHAIHVLSALGHIQCILDRVTSAQGAERIIEREALSLVVEVAHDMRSPLSAILFLVDMRRTGRSGAINALQERQMGIVYGAALGLSQLAGDLLDFVRGHARLIDQHPVPFSVSGVLNAIRDIVQPMAEEKGVSLQLVAPENDARLGLPLALNRVLLNLATNAIKFAKEGQVVVSARQLSPTRVEFSVRDCGRGIPMGVMGQLFQPFRKTEQE